MAQKLFRDPLYDYIAIDIDKHPWLLKLINCPEVQRLRYISQLGLSQFTYPGSTHSRFSHSLGVLHMMQQCLEYLNRDYGDYFNNGDEDALLAAALLHDIGHGPFSHATEDFFGNHEEKSVQIIARSESAVNKVLTEVDGELPAKVAALIAKEPQEGLPQPLLWQKALISSPLDVDRLDYLRRDSLASGAEYGNFDWFRILRTMTLKEKTIKGEEKAIWLVWPDKTKYALEEYLFARFYMYQSVYFHHTTRGFEKLLLKILERAKDVAANNNKTFRENILWPLRSFLIPDGKPQPDDFLYLTDNIMTAQITLWQRDKDKILSDLTHRLLFRNKLAWKEIQGTEMEMPDPDTILKVRNYLQEQGKDHNYYFLKDKTQAPVYKPYRTVSETEDQSSANSIILYDPSWERTGFLEISDVPGLQRLKVITVEKPPPIMRYYFPKEHKGQIKKLLT